MLGVVDSAESQGATRGSRHGPRVARVGSGCGLGVGRGLAFEFGPSFGGSWAHMDLGQVYGC